MKIAITGLFEFNPEMGGAERVSVTLAQKLKQYGYDIYFVALAKSPYLKSYTPVAEQIILPNINDPYCEDNIRCFSNFIIEKKIDVILNQFAHFQYMTNLCIQVKKRTNTKLLSAIHVDPAYNLKVHQADLPMFYARSSFKKYVKFYIKNKIPFMLKRSMKYYANLYRNVYNESVAVILLSEHFKPAFREITGLVDISKLDAITNPLSFSSYEEIYQKEKQLLWVGRFDLDQKRPERLVKIWSYLEDRFPDWNVVFLGDGPCKTGVEKFAMQLGLKNVKFEGYHDPVNAYQKSSILCMTSTFEGFGLVLTEAMQFGTVPVAFDSFDNLCEIIDDEVNGYRIKPFDLKMYASRLSDLMSNEELRNKMSKNAKCHVLEKFCPDTIAAQWTALLNKI